MSQRNEQQEQLTATIVNNNPLVLIILSYQGYCTQDTSKTNAPIWKQTQTSHPQPKLIATASIF